MAGPAALEALRALAQVTSTMPGAEERAAQQEMIAAVADALARDRSIIVQAGTGTGKSLGYLVPVLLTSRRAVVATATKTLQDQLARHDLPLLADHLGVEFTAAVLKGRSNYVCLQRLDEALASPEASLELEDTDTRAGAALRREIEAISAWARRSPDGDFETLPQGPSEKARRAVSVGVDECPGRTKCPRGDDCFAEQARDRARSADVVVVNMHLYGLDVATGGAVLPEHDIVVFDEAHQLESVVSDTSGLALTAARFASFGSAVRAVVADPGITGALERGASRFADIIGAAVSKRFGEHLPKDLADCLAALRVAVASLVGEVRTVSQRPEAGSHQDLQQRCLRAINQGSRLSEDIDVTLGGRGGKVCYVDGTTARAQLKVSPLHVGETLAAAVWSGKCAVLTSATIPSSMPQRVGLDPEQVEQLVVTSPFDYERRSLLYCSPEFPDRRSPEFDAFVHDELTLLIEAAGGRTLALFTSNKALDAAVEAVRPRVAVPILSAREMSRQGLIDRFLAEEEACIFASQSFFQGVDLPGRTLSLVVLDKLPFPRPDEPLLSARRDALGSGRSFAEIDLPICATSLAQAAGRLIRTATDAGVVAVLDRRLATQSYWRTLLAAMPPMPRTRRRDEVTDFLRRITAEGA